MAWWWPLDACDYWYLFIIAIVVLGFAIDWLADRLQPIIARWREHAEESRRR